jgi:hypothetical protein
MGPRPWAQRVVVVCREHDEADAVTRREYVVVGLEGPVARPAALPVRSATAVSCSHAHSSMPTCVGGPPCPCGPATIRAAGQDVLGQRERLMNAQPGTPQDDDHRSHPPAVRTTRSWVLLRSDRQYQRCATPPKDTGLPLALGNRASTGAQTQCPRRPVLVRSGRGSTLLETLAPQARGTWMGVRDSRSPHRMRREQITVCALKSPERSVAFRLIRCEFWLG